MKSEVKPTSEQMREVLFDPEMTPERFRELIIADGGRSLVGRLIDPEEESPHYISGTGCASPEGAMVATTLMNQRLRSRANLYELAADHHDDAEAFLREMKATKLQQNVERWTWAILLVLLITVAVLGQLAGPP